MAHVKLKKQRITTDGKARTVKQKAGDVIQCCDREAHALVRRNIGDLWDPKKKKIKPQIDVSKFLAKTAEIIAADLEAAAEKSANKQSTSDDADSLAAERAELQRQRAQLVDALQEVAEEREELRARIAELEANNTTPVESTDDSDSESDEDSETKSKAASKSTKKPTRPKPSSKK